MISVVESVWNLPGKLLDYNLATLTRQTKPPLDSYGHTWHLYVIRTTQDRRDHIIDTLKSNDISAGVHYKPLTYYPMYKQNTPPVTEREWRRLITLPLFCGLTTEDQDRIVKVVLSCL